MADIKLIYDEDIMECDIKYLNSDFVMDSGLETAVLISLDSDARASESDDYWNDDRRGWWGDDLEGESFGSKMWLLDRAKTTQETLRQAEEYAKNCLNWMIVDGVAAKIETTAERDKDRLKVLIQVYKQASDVNAISFEAVWEAQFEEEQ